MAPCDRTHVISQPYVSCLAAVLSAHSCNIHCAEDSVMRWLGSPMVLHSESSHTTITKSHVASRLVLWYRCMVWLGALVPCCNSRQPYRRVRDYQTAMLQHQATCLLKRVCQHLLVRIVGAAIAPFSIVSVTCSKSPHPVVPTTASS